MTLTQFSNDDPLFVDAAHGDYHLQGASPVIDLDPEPIVALWNESATDLDGSLRIINGERDYGAFERPLPPGAATAAATDVTQTSATVPASANGGGAKATVKLVYGPTTSYGAEIPLDAAPADLADHPYSVALSGLSPATTYHYALVVTNSASTTTSPEKTLTTGAPPTVCCAPPPVAKAALSSLKISPSRFRAASKRCDVREGQDRRDGQVHAVRGRHGEAPRAARRQGREVRRALRGEVPHAPHRQGVHALRGRGQGDQPPVLRRYDHASLLWSRRRQEAEARPLSPAVARPGGRDEAGELRHVRR